MPTVKGFVESILFRNADNGYTVMNLSVGNKKVPVVGNLTGTDVGDCLEVEGEEIEHPVYGKQIKATSYKIVVPDDAQSAERYLGSGAIHGIGAALAKRIVKAFGDDTFRIMEEEPERLAEIKGISERKAMEIAEQVMEKKDMRQTFLFLQQYGITNTMAVRIYERYGAKVIGIMNENPYRLAEDIDGIGFRTADEIAGKMGVKVDSEYRIRCGLLYEMQRAAEDGHTYLPQEKLLQRTLNLLGMEQDPMAQLYESEETERQNAQFREMVEAQLGSLALDRKLFIDVMPEDGKAELQRHVFASGYYQTERSIASMLHELADRPRLEESQKEYIRNRIRSIEEEKNLQLDDLQRQAVMESTMGGVVIITGGPGTGKTTTINTIISYYLSSGMEILLAAPTGRAAKRMTEATGYEAKTIHRLLEVNGQSLAGTTDQEAGAGQNDEKRFARSRIVFEKNAENPLEADAIIIDEMSMVDCSLFAALLKAVMPGTHLILVGDASQLPSVGPGQVLHDLIACGQFPTIVLQKIFRQAEESDIVMNAHRINRGEMPVMDNHSRDFFFLARDNVDVVCKHMIQLIREKLPPYVQATSADIQVLTPMRKGPLGCENLNVILQQYLNPEEPGKAEITIADRTFRVGDKVMQIKNNYQMEWEVLGKFGIPIDGGSGVFNGDTGQITEIREALKEVTVEFEERRVVRYPYAALEELELAYAITIHKSQGSEYPAVILPLLGGPQMLMNRNLLYTGITRARSCVVVLGRKDTVEQMVNNARQLERYTGLQRRIEEIFGALS